MSSHNKISEIFFLTKISSAWIFSVGYSLNIKKFVKAGPSGGRYMSRYNLPLFPVTRVCIVNWVWLCLTPNGNRTLKFRHIESNDFKNRGLQKLYNVALAVEPKIN